MKMYPEAVQALGDVAFFLERKGHPDMAKHLSSVMKLYVSTALYYKAQSNPHWMTFPIV